MALTSWSSCLCLLGAGITSMHYHFYLFTILFNTCNLWSFKESSILHKGKRSLFIYEEKTPPPKMVAGWRDGSMVRITSCSFRAPRFNSESSMLAHSTCNSSSSGLHMCGTHNTYSQTKQNTHTNKVDWFIFLLLGEIQENREISHFPNMFMLSLVWHSWMTKGKCSHF